LQPKISQWIVQYGVSPLILRGPLDDIECKMLSNNGKDVRIGSDWNKFCKLHGVHEGDFCSFKFSKIAERVVEVVVNFR
jgi:hypothetical protein